MSSLAEVVLARDTTSNNYKLQSNQEDEIEVVPGNKAGPEQLLGPDEQQKDPKRPAVKVQAVFVRDCALADDPEKTAAYFLEKVPYKDGRQSSWCQLVVPQINSDSPFVAPAFKMRWDVTKNVETLESRCSNHLIKALDLKRKGARWTHLHLRSGPARTHWSEADKTLYVLYVLQHGDDLERGERLMSYVRYEATHRSESSPTQNEAMEELLYNGLLKRHPNAPKKLEVPTADKALESEPKVDAEPPSGETGKVVPPRHAWAYLQTLATHLGALPKELLYKFDDCCKALGPGFLPLFTRGSIQGGGLSRRRS